MTLEQWKAIKRYINARTALNTVDAKEANSDVLKTLDPPTIPVQVIGRPLSRASACLMEMKFYFAEEIVLDRGIEDLLQEALIIWIRDRHFPAYQSGLTYVFRVEVSDGQKGKSEAPH